MESLEEDLGEPSRVRGPGDPGATSGNGAPRVGGEGDYPSPAPTTTTYSHPSLSPVNTCNYMDQTGSQPEGSNNIQNHGT